MGLTLMTLASFTGALEESLRKDVNGDVFELRDNFTAHHYFSGRRGDGEKDFLLIGPDKVQALFLFNLRLNSYILL